AIKPDMLAALQNNFGLNAQQQAYVKKYGTYAPGESQQQMTQQKDLMQFIATKIFGGARQELPFLGIFENQGAYAATEKYIMANTNPKKYHQELQAAMNTPARQLDIAKKNIEYYGLEIGKAITP